MSLWRHYETSETNKMGMFDYLTCKYSIAGHDIAGREFQTKDTPAQFLHRYEIRDDGTLWHHAYHKTDADEPCNFEGCAKWKPELFDGEIRFYDQDENNNWLEFAANFNAGKLSSIEAVPDDVY